MHGAQSLTPGKMYVGGVSHKNVKLPVYLTLDLQGENVKQETAQSAMDVQIGGDHYKKLKIQPMEYSMANNLDACQHTAIKYITRFRDKGGVADLEKAKHVIDMLIEFEQKNRSEAALEALARNAQELGLGYES